MLQEVEIGGKGYKVVSLIFKYHRSSLHVKGILTDFIFRTLSEILKFEFFAPIGSFPLRNTFPQIWQKSFPHEIRALLA